MSNDKSKLPDLNELAGMVNKLYKDLKSSVSDIYSDYKKKHLDDEPSKPKKTKATAKKKPTSKSKQTNNKK